ncbi:putative Phosphoribulokinase [Planktothrix serta PCC 8927]|uniref:Phosphoribulokinase n=2 Tax=Planktothrix TaxID=54304 RepID=A0A7Z9BMT4_9CYAN|nr:putative Phosphoribulokinase [Planktothrix serta PCC 8927]
MKPIKNLSKNGFELLLGASTLLLTYPLAVGAVPVPIRTSVCSEYTGDNNATECVQGFNQGYQQGLQQIQNSNPNNPNTNPSNPIPNPSGVNVSIPGTSSEYRTGYTSGYRVGIQEGYQNNLSPTQNSF